MSGYRYVAGEALPIPKGAALPPYHLPWCFGCGPENEQGLGLQARIEGDRVVADTQFAPWFAGGPGVVHGGAIAAFFDDLMGFVPVAFDAPAVTARFEINFRRPLPLGASVRGEAWLSAREGRKMWAESSGIGSDGDTYVEAQALFLAVDPDHFARTLAEMPEEQRKRLEGFTPGGYYP